MEKCFNPVAIGQRLREVRGDMSPAEFAERLGVTSRTIYSYETDKRIPDAEFIFNLIGMFDVDPARLLTGRSIEGVSDEEFNLLESYRNSGHLMGIIQTVAIAVADTNIEMERKE